MGFFGNYNPNSSEGGLPLNHKHVISDVINLQDTLDDIQSRLTPDIADITIDDVDGLRSELDSIINLINQGEEVDLSEITNQISLINSQLSNHNHDERYNTKEDLQEVVDFVNLQIAEQYKVKISQNDEPAYLSSKLDNVTLTVEGSELKVKSVDGLTVGTSDISNWLSGTQENIQNQIDTITTSIASITSGMRYRGKLETYADLQSVNNNENGDLSVVLSDETKNNARTLYVYNESLGFWEFVGAFEFSDEFVRLSDTPNSYVGQNGKILKVDETNKKIIFSDIDYSEIKNKPTSTITQIDVSVSKSHEHPNKELLDTYTQTNTDISNTVSKTHEHPNKELLDSYTQTESNLADAVSKKHNHSNLESLNKLTVNANNELLLNGVVYTPKITKEYCFARRVSSDYSFGENSDLIFNGAVIKNITYYNSTGLFYLKAGKTYRVTVTASFNTPSWVKIAMVYAEGSDKDTQPTEAYNTAIWTSVNSTYNEASCGTLDLMITPTTSRYFKIRCLGAGSGSHSLRYGYSALLIHEI